MTVTEVRPLLFLSGVESITYKCEKCRVEESWIFQSASSNPADPVSHLPRCKASERASATLVVELGYPEPTDGTWRRGGFERVR
jgi:hypothetical protein